MKVTPAYRVCIAVGLISRYEKVSINKHACQISIASKLSSDEWTAKIFSRGNSFHIDNTRKISVHTFEAACCIMP